MAVESKDIHTQSLTCKAQEKQSGWQEYTQFSSIRERNVCKAGEACNASACHAKGNRAQIPVSFIPFHSLYVKGIRLHIHEQEIDGTISGLKWEEERKRGRDTYAEQGPKCKEKFEV